MLSHRDISRFPNTFRIFLHTLTSQSVATPLNSCAIDRDSAMAETTMERSIAYTLKMVGMVGLILKPEQPAHIKYLCEGQGVFFWLPTGSGKYLCYKVLPSVIGDKIGRSDSVSIAFSPIISLMVDQMRSLRFRNVRGAILSSGGKHQSRRR